MTVPDRARRGKGDGLHGWTENRPGDNGRFREAWHPRIGATNLNLGAGRDKQPNFSSVDLHEPAKIMYDLDKYPWAWADSTIDNVAACMVLEHVQKPDRFVAEVHRILKPQGKFYVIVPDSRSHEATWGPLTHLRGFSTVSFDHYDPSRDLGNWESTDNSLGSRGSPFKVLFIQVVRRLRIGRLFDSWYHPKKYGFKFPNWGKPTWIRFVLEKQ